MTRSALKRERERELEEVRSGVKRKPEETSEEERQRSNKDLRAGLNMLGFNVDLIEWLLSPELNIVGELNEVRRMVRLYGKGQQQVQAHVSEAYSPKRVTGMADKMGLIPGLAMDLTAHDEHGNP